MTFNADGTVLFQATIAGISDANITVDANDPVAIAALSTLTSKLQVLSLQM